MAGIQVLYECYKIHNNIEERSYWRS
jgi:hypothetical protein